jgi:sugar-phosphatase
MGRWQGDAIIFDLDGVLIDATSVYERHWQTWAERNHVPFAAILAVHHGRPAAQTVELVAPHLDPHREAAAYNQALMHDTDLDGVRAFPGAEDLLTTLPADRWAIATSAPSSVARARLQHVGLPRPPVLVTADDVARGKPDPAPYRLAAQQLGFGPERCLVVEDAPAGVEAGAAAGAFVLVVTTTHQPPDLQQASAVVSLLSDLRVTPGAGGLMAKWPTMPPPRSGG